MTDRDPVAEARERVDSYVRNDPCFRHGSGHLCFCEDLAALESAIAHRACQPLVEALTAIRDLDYRGNRHQSAEIARAALTKAQR